MKLEAKVAQLLVGGFEGTTPPKELKRLIQLYGLGGVIFFKSNLRDPAQIAGLTHRLQGLCSDFPLLFMIDEEGGRIRRLPSQFTPFPPAAALGLSGSFDLTYRTGQATARELRAVGINMNLSPVLDVCTNPANKVIGDRAFGDDPALVSQLGLAMIMGLEDEGVLACGKHFPGHGDTSVDSHKELPVVRHALDRLVNVEFVPFQHAITNRLQTLMTAHVVYTALDPQYPATLSKKVVTRVLRQVMGFRGIVVTDDLLMKAVADHYSIGEAAVRAVAAGADLVLICRDPETQASCHEALVKAVRSGAMTEKRIDLSLQRILSLKKRIRPLSHPLSPKEIRASVGCPAHQKLSQEIRQRARPG